MIANWSETVFTTFTNQYGVPICTSALGSVRSLILAGSFYVKLPTNKEIEGLVMELKAVSPLVYHGITVIYPWGIMKQHLLANV